MAALELRRLGIKQQVEVGRGLEELAERIGRLVVSTQERVEVVMDRLDDGVEMVAVTLMAGVVILAAAGQMRRDVLVLDLVFRAGDDADPWLAILLDRREQDDVVDASTPGRSFSAHLALSTIAVQQSFT
jgi:hypothetical protein